MPEISWVVMAFGLLGGIGLLLYGIQVMGEGLQKMLGRQLRQTLESVTRRPVLGIVVGAAITILFQSSTATTVILVGLTSAAVMTLRQCLPVILGADIGTTVTAQLIALKFTEISLFIVGVGAPIVFFAKRDRHKRIGQAITGFGLLFLGLKILGESMHPLRDYPAFQQALLAVSDNPFLALAVAAIFTFLIHSSAAAVGIIMVLTTQRLIDLPSAIYLLLGANVGTSFTALLASIGSRREAQRVALAHFFSKVGGSALLFPFVGWFAAFLAYLTPSPGFQVANAHTFFNIGLAAVFLPFYNYGARILEFILPEKKIPEFEPKYLNEALITTPSVALGLAHKEVTRLSAETLRIFRDADRALRTGGLDLLDRISHKENVVDVLCQKAVAYLTRVLRQPLGREEFEYTMGLIHVLNDLEKITDIVERNIKFLIETKHVHGVEFSPRGRQELEELGDKVTALMRTTHKALVQDDFCLAEQVILEQPRIAAWVRELRQAHIHRLAEGIKETEATSNLHLELLTSYQQIGELVRDIAFTVAEQLSKSKCCLASLGTPAEHAEKAPAAAAGETGSRPAAAGKTAGPPAAL